MGGFQRNCSCLWNGEFFQCAQCNLLRPQGRVFRLLVEPGGGQVRKQWSWSILVDYQANGRIFVVTLLMCLIFMKRCIFLKKLAWSPLLLSASHDGQAWPKQMLREYNYSKKCKCIVHWSVVFLEDVKQIQTCNFRRCWLDMDLSMYVLYSVLSLVQALWCLFHKNINIKITGRWGRSPLLWLPGTNHMQPFSTMASSIGNLSL